MKCDLDRPLRKYSTTRQALLFPVAPKLHPSFFSPTAVDQTDRGAINTQTFQKEAPLKKAGASSAYFLR